MAARCRVLFMILGSSKVGIGKMSVQVCSGRAFGVCRSTICNGPALCPGTIFIRRSNSYGIWASACSASDAPLKPRFCRDGTISTSSTKTSSVSMFAVKMSRPASTTNPDIQGKLHACLVALSGRVARADLGLVFEARLNLKIFANFPSMFPGAHPRKPLPIQHVNFVAAVPRSFASQQALFANSNAVEKPAQNSLLTP